jgi:hypothetical protein
MICFGYDCQESQDIRDVLTRNDVDDVSPETYDLLWSLKIKNK